MITIDHLKCNAHSIFLLFLQNRKSIPKFLSGKKTFQKCNTPDFKFYLSKLTNKKFPHMV